MDIDSFLEHLQAIRVDIQHNLVQLLAKLMDIQHIPVHFVWHVQHIPFDLVLMDLKYVLRSHTTERFLLLYGKALLQDPYPLEIHTILDP